MRDYLFILLGAALVNNVVLVRFLGLCPFMSVSNKIDSALGMGMATTFVLTLAVAASWLLGITCWSPLDIGFCASGVHPGDCRPGAVHRDVRAQGQPGALSDAGHLPATDHHQLRGVRHGTAQRSAEARFFSGLLYGFGSALGFTLVMVLFAGIRERLAMASVPATLPVLPIAFIAAGLLALAFMGFAGLPVR